MLPKQFVRLFDGRSLFQETVLRNAPLCARTLVVSNTDQYFLAVDQLGEVSSGKTAHVTSEAVSFLLEPMGRNTAPAIALACLLLEPDEVVLVTPSDHRVQDVRAYGQAVAEARQMALDGDLVTFGVRPDFAETGFGYLEADGDRVVAFREKPDLATAQRYVESGQHFWNAGMFCFQAGVFLEELAQHAPEMLSACRAALDTQARSVAGEVIRIDPEAMAAIPADSIDYAVMENSDRVRMVACQMGWSDLGSW